MRDVATMPPPLDFAGGPEAASVVVEALRLAHGYQFNPAFAIARRRSSTRYPSAHNAVHAPRHKIEVGVG